MRVLDAFRPRGATWSGQVISSPGPSGGPSKTHLLPGGGVPRVHRARSPVPPRLPRFRHSPVSASIRSCGCGHLPTASPPQCVVARGTGAAGPVLLARRQWDPLGLAQRLPSLEVWAWRSAPLLPWQVQCPVRVCAALAAGSGGSGRYLVLCLSRVAGRPVRVSLILARWYAIPRGLCVPPARSSCPSGSARVPFACVCARAPAASAPRPPGWSGVRTSRGPGTGRW